MPRFYFHLYDDLDVPDDEGTDLPDLAAALASASRQARELIAETVKQQGRIVLNHRIDIKDEHGTLIESVEFRDVVTIEG